MIVRIQTQSLPVCCIGSFAAAAAGQRKTCCQSSRQHETDLLFHHILLYLEPFKTQKWCIAPKGCTIAFACSLSFKMSANEEIIPHWKGIFNIISRDEAEISRR